MVIGIVSSQKKRKMIVKGKNNLSRVLVKFKVYEEYCGIKICSYLKMTILILAIVYEKLNSANKVMLWLKIYRPPSNLVTLQSKAKRKLQISSTTIYLLP